MAEASLKLGGSWATKDGSLLGFNDQNGNYKPIPFDFTRATTATRINRNGLIEEVQSGVPRIDFTGDGSLLLEPQRTNNFTYSEYIIGWSTSNTGVTVEENAVTSPEGVINATKIKEDGTNAAHAIRQLTGPSLTSGTDYTFSFFAKKAERSIVGLSNTIGASNDKICFFDLENGQVLTNTFNSASIEDFGNGWFRCIATDTADANDDYDTRIYTATADNQFTHQGVSGSGFYIFGLQLEAGSYATSYIPTEGSAVTRNADTSDGGESNNFDSSTAVWFIDLERTGIESGRAIYLADSSSVEQIRLHFDAPAEQIRFRDGKASFANIGGLISMGTSTRKKLALKIDGATLKVFANGSQIGSDYTRPTAFTIEKLIIADDAFKLYDMKFYQSALTDTELQELTTL